MTNYFTQLKRTKWLPAVMLLLLAWLPFLGHAQNVSPVTGMVRSEKGEALQSITVEARIKGTDSVFTTISDAKGVFRFNNIPAGNYVFTFSFVGYENNVMKGYTVKPGATISLVVTMKEKQNDLSQVVVVGYGTQKKVNLTGAVDQVGSEYFEDRPMANASRGLQGVIPNLNIKMTDGKPTRSPSYNVRGTTSIGSGGSALILIDGVPGDPNSINPNDIDNISVLKDASSAAIYGARGSFGVVLITTKTPKKDKFTLNYNGNYSINQRTNTPDLVSDGYTWAKNFDEAFASWNDYISHPQTINTQLPFSLPYLDSLKARHDNPSLPTTTMDAAGKYTYYASTDWFKELYKDNVPSMEHSLSMSGGSEKVNFMISGRYYHQDGVFRYNTDDFDRYNVRIKGSAKVTDWLTINSNTDFSSFKYKYPLTSLGGVNAVWRLMAVSAFPVSPLLNPDGTMTIVGAYSIGDFYYGKSNSLLKQNYIRNTIGFNANLINNRWALKGDFSYMYTNQQEDRKFFPVPYSIQKDQIINGGPNSLSNNTSTENYYVANVYSDYTQKFGKHNFKALVGWNLEMKQNKYMFAQRDGLLVDNLPDFNLATGLNYRLTGGGQEWATVGVFYRLNYDFNNKYLLEFNGRYDGSSKFPESQQYGFFPSASAGWRVSEEHFMENTRSWLDNLKLRVSYGSLGNGNIDPYTFIPGIGSGTSSYIMNGTATNYIQQPGVVPDGLTWEKATTFDVGLDAEFLNRRLSLSVDWYRRNTTGMIVAGQPLPAVFGAGIPRGNFADLKTSGWETSVTWTDQIHAGNKPITYSVRLTLADNISYITDFNNPTNLLSSYYKGQRLGEIWGFQTDGFFESTDDIAKHADQSYFVVSNNNKLMPGDLRFKDRNGDNKVNIGKNTVQDPGDQFVVGNSSIRFPYGITGNIEWNGISLSMFFQGVGKRDWYPSTEAAYFWGQMNRVYSFLPTFNLDRWTEENPSQDAYFPRYRGYTALSGTRELAVKQTRYLQDASYIRLKNITVGYSLPRNVLNRLHLSSARIYFTGQNLWTYSPMYKITKNFDPEVIEGSDPEVNSTQGDGFSYPMQKSWTIGVNIGL